VRISHVSALQIFDSRGTPTIEAEVVLENGARGRGQAPSGISTGKCEAFELRDGDPALFRGKSVERAVTHVNTEIARAIHGMPAEDQNGIDHVLIGLDGTKNKMRLGANAILAVSMAVAKASARAKNMPLFESLGQDKGNLLPLPQIQIFGGGAHADHRIDIQDFLVIAIGAKTYAESLRMTFEVYLAARDVLMERHLYYGVADEGGYWPAFSTNDEVLQTLVEAIERAGYEPGKQVSIALDIAAAELFDEAGGCYRLSQDKKTFSSTQFMELIVHWCETYPIVSIEDPMSDTDWEGWRRLHASLDRRIQLVGDDLFCTNESRINKGIAQQVANAVLIKPNQVGTVSETLAAIRCVQEAGWLPIISARSGETEDTFISHLAVATNAGQLKVGAFSRGERIAKWNELLRIERELGERARFVGGATFQSLGNYAFRDPE
jgi:enolase